MRPDDHPSSPSLPWRTGSTIVMGMTGLLTRGFLYGLSSTTVEGLDGFLKLLDERRDIEGRERGLVTGISSSGVLQLLDADTVSSIEPCQCVRT